MSQKSEISGRRSAVRFLSLAVVTLLTFLTLLTRASGALSANTVWEVRPSGVDTNGGGYVSGGGGTDYSVQDVAQFSGTNLASTNGTTNPATVTSATHNFVAADVGNLINISAGTSWTQGIYQIVSVASNAATLDRACGSSASLSSGTWKEGGALASIGKCGSAAIAGNILYIYNAGSTVYSVTSATVNIANGCFSPAAMVVGYATNRTITNTDTPPTLQLNVASATIFTGIVFVWNLTLDGNSQTTSKATTNGGSILYGCTIKNFTGTAVATGQAFYCVATGNSARAFNYASYCWAYANTASPFGGSASIFVDHCIATGNSGVAGFTLSSSTITNCSSYGNGTGLTSSAGGVAVNLILEGNTTAALSCTSNYVKLLNVAYDSGFTFTGNGTSQAGVINYTGGSAFVNAAGNNFALNNLPNQGALLHGAGFTSWFYGSSTGYPDVGAVQSPWSGASRTRRGTQ